jgi:hypothetical protein
MTVSKTVIWELVYRLNRWLKVEASVVSECYLSNQNWVLEPFLIFLLQLISPITFKSTIVFQKADICDLGVVWVYLAPMSYFQTLWYWGFLNFHHHLSSNAIFSICKSRISIPPISLSKHKHFQATKIYFFLWLEEPCQKTYIW